LALTRLANSTTKWLRRVPVRLGVVRFLGLPKVQTPVSSLLLFGVIIATLGQKTQACNDLTIVIAYAIFVIMTTQRSDLSNKHKSAQIIQFPTQYQPPETDNAEDDINFYERTRGWSPERKRNFIKHSVIPVIAFAGVVLIAEHFIDNNPEQGYPSVLQNWYNDADYAVTGAEFSTQNIDYVIEEGDSLFGIASHIKGAENVELDDVVAKIKELNSGVDLGVIHPGQTIVIPAETSKNIDFSSHETN
jgi:hypothetical protein